MAIYDSYDRGKEEPEFLFQSLTLVQIPHAIISIKTTADPTK